MENSHSDFISVINSLLLIVDYQTELIDEVRSAERSGIMTAAVASVKAASILNVPIVLTSRAENENGIIINEITDLTPGNTIIRRDKNTKNAFDDERVVKALKKFNRDKLVITGLLTSESMTEAAISAVNEGYDVYGLIDACGDISGERHNYGVQKMLKAGITPITWMSLASEWMNGWTEPVIGDSANEVFGKYNVMLSFLSKH